MQRGGSSTLRVPIQTRCAERLTVLLSDPLEVALRISARGGFRNTNHDIARRPEHRLAVDLESTFGAPIRRWT